MAVDDVHHSILTLVDIASKPAPGSTLLLGFLLEASNLRPLPMARTLVHAA